MTSRTFNRTRPGQMNRPIRPSLPVLLLILLFSLAGWAAAAPAKKKPSKRQETAKHVEVGMASWYGRKFHGRKTASGERFNMYDLTAAHRSLPFGTRVKVTNLENQRSVIVRINDRGPHRKGRIIDLSYAAAKEIRMIERGVVKVKLEVVK